MRQKNIQKRLGVIMTVVIMVLISSAAVFAGESEGEITVQITVGQNGSINGHTESYTETVLPGDDLVLDLKADDGLVISSVLVNETALSASDLEGILGQNAASLTLEDLLSDAAVNIVFAEKAVPVEDPADENDTAGEISDDEEDPAGEISEGDGDSAEDGNGADTEEPASDEDGAGVDSEESPGSLSTGEGTVEEVDLDDPGQAGGEEDPEGSAQAGGEEDPEETEKDGKPGKPEKEEGKAGSETGGKSTETSVGKGSAEDYSHTSPKTGDAFPMQIILVMLASLCGIAALVVRVIMRRRSENSD